MEKLRIIKTAEGSIVALTQRQRAIIKSGLALVELTAPEAGPQAATDALGAVKTIRTVLEGVVPTWND